MNIYETIKALVQYAENEKLIEKEDSAFALNRLLEALNLDSFEEAPVKSNYELKDILGAILDYACENGLCENSIVYRDLFDTKLWGFLHQDLPRLSVNSAQNIQKAPKLQLIITTISAVRAITYGNTELKMI